MKMNIKNIRMLRNVTMDAIQNHIHSIGYYMPRILSIYKIPKNVINVLLYRNNGKLKSTSKMSDSLLDAGQFKYNITGQIAVFLDAAYGVTHYHDNGDSCSDFLESINILFHPDDLVNLNNPFIKLNAYNVSNSKDGKIAIIHTSLRMNEYLSNHSKEMKSNCDKFQQYANSILNKLNHKKVNTYHGYDNKEQLKQAVLLEYAKGDFEPAYRLHLVSKEQYLANIRELNNGQFFND